MSTPRRDDKKADELVQLKEQDQNRQPNLETSKSSPNISGSTLSVLVPELKRKSILHCTRGVAPQRVTSQGPTPQLSAWAGSSASMKRRSGGKSLATLYPI